MAGENDALWDAMKRSKYRNTMRMLLDVSVADCANPESFLSSVLNIVANAVHAEIGTLWYYAQYDDNRIRPKAQFGGDENIGSFSLALGEGVAGAVIESGNGTIIHDCQKDRRWSGRADSKTGLVTRTMMCAPIKEADSIFGCIQLINRTDGALFDREDFEFLEKLCLEVAKLFNQQAKVFMMDRFEARGIPQISQFGTIETAKNRREMLNAVHTIPRYEQLDESQAIAFDAYCSELWRMMHEE